MDILHYTTIESTATAEFKDRGSKFIAYAYPLKKVSDFKPILQELKKMHPKAVHHCFAYKIGINGNDYRISDDGEPAGTAGKPIFNVIESKNLTNICIIVVRYFGGTLLGVPGLINAYKTAASLVLQIIPFVQKPVEKSYQLSFNYTLQNDVMRILKINHCSILQQSNGFFAEITIGIPVNQLAQTLAQLKELYTLEMKAIEITP
ncbi:MAG: IMPACT family protein [Chitinophagaceae bacterium]